MKIKLFAKENIAIGRLYIKAENLEVYYQNNKIKSQWISFSDGGILILDTDKRGECEFEIKVVDKNSDECVCENADTDVEFNGAFPYYKNVTFYDGVYCLMLAGQENEPWRAKRINFLTTKMRKLYIRIKANLQRL